jgi:hypothetical protein
VKELNEQLQNIVIEYSPLLNEITEEEYAFKSSPSKWSKKEILGHLIDSAQNNIRRFVVSQYENIPKIVYKQDSWVLIANYQQYPIPDLILLWVLLNRHISIILENTSELNAKRETETNGPHFYSMEWLVADYIKHLVHHLHQVLNLEPIPYP